MPGLRLQLGLVLAMKKLTKHQKRLTLSAEKLRELQSREVQPVPEQALRQVAGGMGCDCSSAMCD